VKLELQATPEEVMRAVETLQQFCLQEGISEKTIFGLALALEECGSNVVHHALQGDQTKTFSVKFEHIGNTFVIELRDRGPEFDPTAAPERLPAEEDDEREPGGWGIQLVRRYIDDIGYRREAGENVLRLTKRLKLANEQ
jgi:anti-sigma regulatory factor (Ser/Thr protein kinase)